MKRDILDFYIDTKELLEGRNIKKINNINSFGWGEPLLYVITVDGHWTLFKYKQFNGGESGIEIILSLDEVEDELKSNEDLRNELNRVHEDM